MPAGGFNAAGSRLGNWKRRLGDSGYEEQLERIFPFVESVGADGLYEVVEEFTVWRSVTDPRERVRKVLGGLYSYYEGTAEMLENVYRDAASVPASVPALRGIEQGLEPVSDMLADAYSPRGRRRRLVTAAAQHAADFRTWLSLTRDRDLSRRQAAELMASLIECAAEQGTPLSRGRR